MKREFSVTDIANYKPKLAEFDGEFKELVGDPELKGSWIIWGNSYNGKTRFAFKLARYLCNFGSVIYDSLEEGLSMTIQKAVSEVGLADCKRRFSLFSKVCMQDLVELLKKRRSAKIVIVDSLQYTQLNYSQYTKLLETFPNKLFIFISHAEGTQPEGQVAKSVKYDANVKIRVEGYKAFAQSRYGGGKPFTIWEEGAKQYWNDMEVARNSRSGRNGQSNIGIRKKD